MTETQRLQLQADMEYFARRAEGKKRSTFRVRIEQYTRSLELTGYSVTWNDKNCLIRKIAN